jgi:hypothetical protein
VDAYICGLSTYSSLKRISETVLATQYFPRISVRVQHNISFYGNICRKSILSISGVTATKVKKNWRVPGACRGEIYIYVYIKKFWRE